MSVSRIRPVVRAALPLLVFAAFAAWGQEPPVDAGTEAMEIAGGLPEDAAAGPSAFRWVVLTGGISLVAVLAAVGRRYAAMVTLLAGLLAVFMGERLFVDGTMHWPLTGLGVVAVVASLGMRLKASMTEVDVARASAQRHALVAAGVTLLGLGVYALTTEPVATSFGFEDEALSRWQGVWAALTPIVLLCGLLPTVFIDRVLAVNPIVLPRVAAKRAARAGLATALAVSMLFPLNYVAKADKYRIEADYSYFRTTDVGTATMAVARTLSEPVTAYLYFPPGNDVRGKVEPYFSRLAAAADGMLTVEVVDAAMRPDLAEAHSIRENGYVVLASGDNNQKFKVGTDIDRAKRQLRTLDGSVQKHLLKLSGDEQIVYFLTGHGEANWRERDNPARKLREFKSTLEDLNFQIETLGVTEGSAVAIPDDAALVVVAAPMLELLPEEEAALLAYLDGGGSMLLLLDPGAARLDALTLRLGIAPGIAPIAHATAYVPTRRGIANRILIATNRFGTHDAVTTVSRNSTMAGLVLPTVLALNPVDGAAVDTTTLVRSFPESWEDVDNDRQRSDAEPARVFDLALAVEPPDEEGFRAIVIGDVSVFSDASFGYSRGNQWFAEDAAKWLVHEDDLVGETEREEDVEIRHTREGEGMWFWGTILGVPLLLLVLGGIYVNLRRKA